MKPITAVIVGAGHRALGYAEYAQRHPEALRIVGVAEPDDLRRRQAAARFAIPAPACFTTADELAGAGKLADAVINGTMDQQHVATSLPLLRVGYDMLLEKPFATNETEMRQLADAARQWNRKVMICHVLRYAPFYAAIRQRVVDGEIGRLLNIQTSEHVSYHHMAVAYVRGKWNHEQRCGSSMLLAKCCHDLDLVAWMKSGVAPTAVSSFGSRMYFRPEQAPAGAGRRCLVDCEIEPDCLYSARKHYLDHPGRWASYVWAGIEHVAEPTPEQRLEWLKTGPFGRCVWHCDNEVVDHQTVVVEFADGATASHNMVGGAARPERSIHLIGTHGEIQGTLESGRFVIHHADPRPGKETATEVVDVSVRADMHGGGDLRLVADFLRFLKGEPRSVSCTTIDDSVHGHQIVFAADRARTEGRVVKL